MADTSLDDHDTVWRTARRAVVLCLVAGVPVVFDPGIGAGFRIPKLLLAATGAMAILGLWIGERMDGPHGRVVVPPCVAIIGIWLGWLTITALLSPSPVTGMLGSRSSYNGVVTSIVVVVAFLASAEAFDPSSVRVPLAVLWFGAGGVAVFYGAIQLHDVVIPTGEWDPVPWDSSFGGTLWSTMGSPTTFGAFLAILIPVGVALLVAATSMAIRLVIAVQLGLLAVELMVTTPRGATAGALAGLVVVAALYRRALRDRLALALIVGFALAAIVGTAGLLLVRSGHTRYSPSEAISAGERDTVRERLDIWSTAWRMAMDHPFVGVGPDGFEAAFPHYRDPGLVARFPEATVATDAHNVLLTRLAESGFPGLILWAGILVAVARHLLRPRGTPLDRATRASLAACLGGSTAWMVQALFGRQHIGVDFCFWVLLGLACAASRAGAEGVGARDGSVRTLALTSQ